MKMIEEPIPSIRLSKTQLKILNVLRVSPKALKPIFLFNFLKDRKHYFSLWRSLQLLERNNLVIRTDNFYSITKEGMIEFDKRRKLNSIPFLGENNNGWIYFRVNREYG